MPERRSLSAAVISHKGCERANNEDSFFFNGDWMPLDQMDQGALIVQDFSADSLLFAVCDGMGGAQSGEIASHGTVQRMLPLMQRLPGSQPSELIERFCHEASLAVYQEAQRQGAKYQGTTLAMVAIDRQEATIANVGDSRVYLLRQGNLEQLSDDHSEVNRLVKAGLLTREQARKHERSNIITHYIGMGQREQSKDFAFMRQLPLYRGDRLMICSDGISDLISDERLRAILHGASDPEQAVVQLANTALELGGKDNLSCIVLDCGEGFLSPLPAQGLETLSRG